MQRFVLFALLVIAPLFAGIAQAQRGGAIRGGGHGRNGIAFRFGRHPGLRVFPGHHRFHKFGEFNSVLVPPFWYDGAFDYEQPVALNEPEPPVVIVPPEKLQAATPPLPAAPAKLIEIPGKMNSAAPKPLPPAIFVLTNGQRFQAQRYMLTHVNLYATVDRQPLTIPYSLLDINATLAANRAHGIDLRIPVDRNEVFVGF